jgi:DNA-directed RNA polymerase subunit RPC12/RpoP
MTTRTYTCVNNACDYELTTGRDLVHCPWCGSQLKVTLLETMDKPWPEEKEDGNTSV